LSDDPKKSGATAGATSRGDTFASAVTGFGPVIAPAPTREEINRAVELHEASRQSLFVNEGFALGALQTAAAAIAFGVLNQLQTLQGLSGRVPAMVALTLAVFGLGAGVASSVFRHHYRMWEVKSRVRGSKDETEAERLAKERWKTSTTYLAWMRGLMHLSTLAILTALATLLTAMWLNALG
jgi:hypothetical protein